MGESKLTKEGLVMTHETGSAHRDPDAGAILYYDNGGVKFKITGSASEHTVGTAASIAAVQADVDANEATSDAAEASLTTRLATEEARVDAILNAAAADKDSFAEIVTFINSVDLANDNALAAAVLSISNSISAVQSDVDQNESDSDAAEASLTTRIAVEEAASANLAGGNNFTGPQSVSGLLSATNMSASSNVDVGGDLTVGDDLVVRDDVTVSGLLGVGGNIYTSAGDISSVQGNIAAPAGNVWSFSGDLHTTQGDVYSAGGNVFSTNGDLYTTNGDIRALNGAVSASFLSASSNVDVGGDVAVAGNITLPAGQTVQAGEFLTYSERALKTNIEPVSNALGMVQKMQGVTYKLKTSGKSEIGFIADDMANVAPEVCGFHENGNPSGINYGRLTSVLVEAIKSQQDQIKAQQMQIEELKTLIKK